MNYWLFKSEPNEFSIDDLANQKNKTDHWDGVRNYQARNMMRDEIKVGDNAFFYHSSCADPGIVGVMKISRQGYSDHTAFDKKNAHFDPKSDPGNPRWYMVDVTFKEKFNRVLTLAELKTFTDKQLKDFQLLKKGNRLSIMPVSAKTWEFVYRLASQRN